MPKIDTYGRETIILIGGSANGRRLFMPEYTYCASPLNCDQSEYTERGEWHGERVFVHGDMLDDEIHAELKKAGL